jgi:transcriptional regulator with XRE-family HTH domain
VDFFEACSIVASGNKIVCKGHLFMYYIEENREYFDFTKIGNEVKAERERRGWTREKAAAMLDISESYLKAIENNGYAPGSQLFYRIMKLFSISVDKHFFPDTGSSKHDESLYLQAAGMLREREASELYVLISTMDGMDAARKLNSESGEE